MVVHKAYFANIETDERTIYNPTVIPTTSSLNASSNKEKKS
ncbi:MAG: hypothetical protein SPL96_06365 [Bacteroidales bacterium]|nr:hypothetical protein [Bacteroidales bacterium]